MKKIWIFLLCGMFLFTTCGCSGEDSINLSEENTQTNATNTEIPMKNDNNKEISEDKKQELSVKIEKALVDYDIIQIVVEDGKKEMVAVYVYCQMSNIDSEYPNFVKSAIPLVVEEANKIDIEISMLHLEGKEDEDVSVFWSTYDGKSGQIIDNRPNSAGFATLTVDEIESFLVGTYEPERVEPAIGMTESEVCSSTWGMPKKKNKTETENGTHEQWVYEDGYIYFDNGYVTSIQK